MFKIICINQDGNGFLRKISNLNLYKIVNLMLKQREKLNVEAKCQQTNP